MVIWPWSRKGKPRNVASYSISDPRLARIFDTGPPNFSGSQVSEQSALSLSAVYRAVSLISGSIAQLPLRTLIDGPDGTRERVTSVFDAPDGADGLTRYEWVETIMVHLLLHGNAYLLQVRNGAGALYALHPIHPLLVCTEWPLPTDSVQPVGGKWFTVTDLSGRQERYDARTIVHIPALSSDGLVGLSPINVARNSFGTALSGDRAAARLFDRGALMGGIASPDEDLDPDELNDARQEINRHVSGWDNAGGIALVNRKLNLSPWTINPVDSQFLQSRQFSVEEIGRWYGIPPHLLGQTDKQTSWGTGVAEQNRGLGRFTLANWTARLEQRLSRLLRGRWVEFDYAGLERPNIEVEIGLLVQQVNSKLLTVDEARAIRNLPPLGTGG